MAQRAMELKVAALDKIYGPVAMDKLIELAVQGRITPDDLVRPVGTKDWVRATDVPALAESVRRPPSGADDLLLDDTLTGGAEPPRRKRRAEDVEMDMTPMIDVTFQLLIFFMLTNALANPSAIETPKAAHGRGVTVDGRQLVLIDDAGKYYLGDSVAAENLSPSLDALAAEISNNVSGGQAEVIVNAHPKAKHRQVRELVERLGGVSGVTHVLLGVQEPMQ